MLNRQKRREFEDRIKKGTVNPGHLHSLSMHDLVSLCSACGVDVKPDREAMVKALLALNGSSVKIPAVPTVAPLAEQLSKSPDFIKLKEELSDRLSERLVVITLYTLRSEFGFAEKRIDRFLAAFNEVTSDISEDRIDINTLRDITSNEKLTSGMLKDRYELAVKEKV